MPPLRTAFITICLLLAGLCTQAQQPAGPPQLPTVIFKLSWDKGLPWSDYTFTVSENGATHFKGIANPADGGDDDTFEQDFTMSEANRQKVFEAAKATDYFQGQFETKTRNVAKTGAKTLEFHSPWLNTSTTYNYSPNPNIQQLTDLFHAIATTIDYGRKLTFQYRFDKLGMDARLKELVDLHAGGEAEELLAIEPILRKIADDDGVMHMTRSQAKALLKSANSDGSAAKSDSAQP
ncbi:MAG: hypothetical protein WAM71_11395 [Candidatus Korobacteraceae bacterium]